VLLPVSTVGVMGDERSYESVIALRAVETTDFMTADFSYIPYEVLGLISSRVINEIRGVNRVVYDISSKPPPRSNGSDSRSEFRVHAVQNRLKAELQTMSSSFPPDLVFAFSHNRGYNGAVKVRPRDRCALKDVGGE